MLTKANAEMRKKITYLRKKGKMKENVRILTESVLCTRAETVLCTNTLGHN